MAAAVMIGRDAFGLKTQLLTCRDSEGRIAGVLPLVEQSSMLFGHNLVSLPYFTYGGVLADREDVAVALAERAATYAAERGADHMLLRQASPIGGLAFSERLDKVSMERALPDTEKELSRELGSKLRSQIRRADREKPEVVWGGSELLNEFYEVFAPTMHQLGTPVYSRAFFDVVLRAFGSLASVIVVRVNGEVQASAIIVRHGDRIEVPWAAATPVAKRNSVNMRMYWEMLKASVERGASAFDFGRSTVDSGTYRFKKQWGAEPRQLHWYYWLPQGRELPRLDHANPKYAMAATVWRRMPLWCANLIGPRIVRHLP